MKTQIRILALSLCLGACAAPKTSVPSSRTTLDHIAINVANAETSAEFYKGIFGFAKLNNPFAGGGGVVWLDLGNGIALQIFGGRKIPIANERERHLAVAVHDMSQVTTYLKSHGLGWQDFDGVAGRVQTRPDGVQQLFFQDPDGYWIEVNDSLKKSKRRE